MRIRGSVAWITGGSSGIGAALAHELSRRGASVAVTARRADLLEQVAASAPGEVRALPGDVREPAELRAAVGLAPLGVDVQLVNPGFVRTPLTEGNDFPTPFMIEAPDAARRIADAIEQGKAEAVFPLPYRVGMKLVRLVPIRLYTAVSRRFVQAG